MAAQPTVGIIALQGDCGLHALAFRRAGARVRFIRLPEELAGVQALTIPGGESTTMTLLGYENGLWPAVNEVAQAGTAVLGTCAGIIMLATELREENSGVVPLKLLDIAVARNAYGSQVDSFEATVRLQLAAEPSEVPGVFIRAPAIVSVDAPTQAVGWLDGQPVMARKDKVLGLTFHPEVTGDLTIHRYFLSLLG